jgi:hypothetical protein
VTAETAYTRAFDAAKRLQDVGIAELQQRVSEQHREILLLRERVAEFHRLVRKLGALHDPDVAADAVVIDTVAWKYKQRVRVTNAEAALAARMC